MTLKTPVQTRSKLPDVGTTIFTVIGQLSARHNAINLSQGAPNFSCDPKLITGVTRAMEAGHNQYASMTGLQPLRERIADKIASLYGTLYDPAREGLAALTRHTDIIILSDEVYEHVVFDGEPHHGMATHPQLAERSVIISSFGKTFHVTGWRVGYCVAPAELMDEICKVHQFLMFSADTPMQYAFAEHMTDPQTWLSLAAFYQRKRDLLQSLLADSPFRLLPSAGSFFLLADYSGFSDERDSEMVKRLIVEYGVATIPLSAFYADGTDNKLIRLSFAKDEATLRAGAQALCRVTPR